MSSAAADLATRTAGSRPLAIGTAVLLAAVVVLVLLGWFTPIQPLLRGWLVAFAIFSAVPIGSMIWLLIHRLTGGEWGFAAAPVLRPAAAMTPLAGARLRARFWPGSIKSILGPPIPPQSRPMSRIGISTASIRAPQSDCAGRLVVSGGDVRRGMRAAGCWRALGLAFFGLTISLVAVDWYLSLEPHYVATAFASMVAIQQLLAALAIAAMIGPPADRG